MDNEARKRLITAIKRARGDRSQRRFAQDLGVSYSAIQSWERGDSLPSLESLEAIANSLGQSIEELLAYARGLDSPSKPAPKVAEDVLIYTDFLAKTEKSRLIKILLDQIVSDREK